MRRRRRMANGGEDEDKANAEEEQTAAAPPAPAASCVGSGASRVVKNFNGEKMAVSALLLLLQKKENAILLHTLRVIKPTRGVLKRIVIHKIRILCGLLLLMHLFAFLFNKIAHLGRHYALCILSVSRYLLY